MSVLPPMPAIQGNPAAAAAPAAANPFGARPATAPTTGHPMAAATAPVSQDGWLTSLNKTGADLDTRGNALTAFGCPWSYQLQLLSVTPKVSQKRVPFTVVKFKVLASNNPQVPVGLEVEDVAFFDGQYDNKYYYEKMFQLGAAAWSYHAQEVVSSRQMDSAVLQRMQTEEQLFKDAIINVTAMQRINKKENKLVFDKDGKPVVALTYSPVQIATGA